MAKFGFFAMVIFLMLAIGRVDGRSTKYLRVSKLISAHSDGEDERKPGFSSLLTLKNSDYHSWSSSDEYCEPLYGFVPCSTNVFGFLFLILIYEYLLFHGESYVNHGSEIIFKILGPGVFGASAFHVLGALPEALIVLAIGLSSSTKEAQEHVTTVVGLIAGTTILQLTLIWGTCVIVGNNNFSDDSISNRLDHSNLTQRLFSSPTGYGITIDDETKYTARIMVVSVIPYIIMQIPTVFSISSEENIFIMASLIVSLVFLAFYFFYQIFQPWIQERRWEVVINKQKISDILQTVRKQALEKILDDDGAPNVDAIKGLFANIDEDCDNNISTSEVREFIVEINKFKRMFSNEGNTLQSVMKTFDINGDSKLNIDEFVEVITKWLDETKGSSDKSFEDLHEVLQPWIDKKRRERERKDDLILEILRHFQSSVRENLLKEGGAPNVHNIRRLFEKLDKDKNNCISLTELKEVIVDLNFGNLALTTDEVVEEIMQDLDTNKNQKISEHEFVTGISRWLQSGSNYQPLLQSTASHNARHQEILEEETEIENIEGNTNDKNSILSWVKAVVLLVVGIAIVSSLAEPLINSVQKFSEAASIPSFFISFILVPLATNARGTMSAVTEASRKKSRATSLTFSEIYGGVFMNNIMSLSVLLGIIYKRSLTWNFSGEVLVVLVVCVMLGVITSFRTMYPIWTSAVAIAMYPLSLLAVYVLDDVLDYA